MADALSQTRMRALPAGDRALLLALDDPADLVALVDELRRLRPDGVEDVLPAAETVLVTLAPGADRSRVRQRLSDLLDACLPASSGETPRGGAGDSEPVSIPVRYDGADLDDVAALLEMPVADVVAAHTERIWRCSFIGFAPGFGYLESRGHPLVVPRRSESRTRVPAGAVALADGYSAVYPRETPGGWQVIGTTDAALWDLDRDPPALLQPGTRVRFVDRDSS